MCECTSPCANEVKNTESVAPPWKPLGHAMPDRPPSKETIGDVVLLIRGGHGFEVLEPLEMLEIKQGPYLGDQDKTRFGGVEAERIRIVEAT